MGLEPTRENTRIRHRTRFGRTLSGNTGKHLTAIFTNRNFIRCQTKTFENRTMAILAQVVGSRYFYR